MNAQINQQFLTIRDVQEYLNISKSSAYELVHSKDFPSCRLEGVSEFQEMPFWHG